MLHITQMGTELFKYLYTLQRMYAAACTLATKLHWLAGTLASPVTLQPIRRGLGLRPGELD